jgi:hypothetical protein
VVVFQSAFHLEMYQNHFFYFLKIIFDINSSKWSENTKKILIWSKEKYLKISIFFKSTFEKQCVGGDEEVHSHEKKNLRTSVLFLYSWTVVIGNPRGGLMMGRPI